MASLLSRLLGTEWKEEPRYCQNCGFVGAHRIEKEISGGQWAFLVVCFLCFVIPGIIYALHLATGGGSNEFWECPRCGARLKSLPMDSTVAQGKIAGGTPIAS